MLLLATVLLPAGGPARAQAVLDDLRWTHEPGVAVPTLFHPSWARAAERETVTADLFRPRAAGRLPAVVIINSSGGVTAHTELFYGRLLAEHGVIALVVDSFTPRGVRRTVEDQTRVSPSRHYADAAAGFRWLAARPDVDAARIAVLGMSRGGNAALVMAVETDRRALRVTDVRFAAHVAIAPGCGWQARDARSTGAPILFALSELDDYTPIAHCLEFAERLRQAGNAQVRLAVYPGVYHTQEWTGGIATETAERSSRCRFLRDEGWRSFDRTANRAVPVAQERAYYLQSCVDQGPVTIGGDARTKAQLVADILQFLRDAGVVEDAAARAAVPDCAVFSGTPRRNCERARNGWAGDMVALGRAHRYGGAGIAADPAVARRLFALAADRGHPQARWELALMQLRSDLGAPRDAPAAVALLRAAAEAGEAPAMNTLGVVARDGLAGARDDAEAAAWFRRAAALRNSYAQMNLGRFHWHGRGGVPQDDALAVRLLRLAEAQDNPWAHLYLGEAQELGRGTRQDRDAAIASYRRARDQGREPEAAQAARRALERLGAG